MLISIFTHSSGCVDQSFFIQWIDTFQGWRATVAVVQLSQQRPFSVRRNSGVRVMLNHRTMHAKDTLLYIIQRS